MPEFIDIVRLRRSVRRYRPDAIPRESIEKCLEAARHAPTACDTQSWRFIVTEGALKDLIAKQCLGELPVPNKWAVTAPVIIVMASASDLLTHRIGARIKGTNYELIDAGIAGEHFVLQAAELGLGTCWLGWFKKKKIRKILDLPAGWDITALITLGYPEGDIEEKARKPIDEIREYRR
jgi:nitroreductase